MDFTNDQEVFEAAVLEAKNSGFPFRAENAVSLGRRVVYLTAEEIAAATAMSLADLASRAAKAQDDIDAAAGAARARYLTIAPGQEATYIVKEQQARAYMAAAYTGTVPLFVQAEADAGGISAQAAADLILAHADLWLAKGAEIEQARRAGKMAVEAAQTNTAKIAARDAAISALAAL